MHFINTTDRLPPTPPPGEVVVYPVIYMPTEGGFHRNHLDGVGWDGKGWVWWGYLPDDVAGMPFDDGTVVSWADPLPQVTRAPAPVQSAPAADDSTYTVTLTGYAAASKIAVIKLVRELTGLGLGEAKAFVESAAKPIKQGLTHAEADMVGAKVVAAGGTVTVTAEGA